MNHPFSRATLYAGALLGALVVDASAQSRNVSLVGQFDVGEFVNDVWGYTNPANGKEYALLLTYNGTYVLDCSNPAAPVQRGFFARITTGSGNTWRDARTYGHYAYVVSEAGSGMQIIDLANPDAPVFVRTHTVAGVSWGHSHNICIDTQTGRAYAVGTNSGVLVFDLAANPTNPPYLGAYTTQYVHDMQVQDGYAYLAEINRNFFRISNATAGPTLPTVGVVTQRLAHNAWPTRDGNYALVTTEDYGYGITIYDVTNKANPLPISTYHAGSSQAIVHNVYALDRQAHMSHYSEGYRNLDISDPANPVEIGFYDTSTFTSGYEGDWGCYPFSPSGVIYVSDMDNGLMILKPTGTAAHYGAASPGTGGVAPELHGFGATFLGNANFGVEVEHAPASSNCTFLIGLGSLNVTFQGLTLLVDTTIGAAVTVPANANGFAHIGVPVPNDPNLVGVHLYAQCFAQDAGGPLGFTATDGLDFTIFAQ